MCAARKDSWAGELLDDEAAEIFERWRVYKGAWEEFAEWIASTYPKSRKPSRSALYAWASTDPAHPGAGFRAFLAVRSARIRAAGKEMAEWARSIDESDETLANGFKALGCDAYTVARDGKLGAALMAEYRNLTEQALHRQEISLKARAQSTKDEQLKLAREKFEAAEKRLSAVQGAVDAPQLTDAERVAKIKGIFGMK